MHCSAVPCPANSSTLDGTIAAAKPTVASATVDKSVSAFSVRTTDTGESYVAGGQMIDVDWTLHSSPECVFVANQKMLSTRLGTFLQNLGFLDVSLLEFVVLQLLLSILVPVDPVSWSSRWRLMEVPRAICISSHIVVAVGLAFFLLHRCNRQVLLHVMCSSRFVLLFGSIFLAHSTWVLSSLQETSSDKIEATVGNIVLIAFRVPVMILASATDSLFACRVTRLAIVLFLCICCLWSWFDSRCVSHSWGVRPNCAIFDVDDFSAREIFIFSSSQRLILLLTGFLRLASGRYFCYVSPKFVHHFEGNDDGVLYSCDPPDLHVKRSTILSTSLGRFLEKHRLMNAAMLVSLFCYGVGSTAAGRFQGFSQNGENVIRNTKPGLEIVRTWTITWAFCLDLALMHRWNLALFRMSFKRFEGWYVAGSGIVSVLVLNYHMLSTFGTEDLPFRLLEATSAFVASVLVASLDALRSTRRVKIAINGLAIVFLSYSLVDDRCVSLRWDPQHTCDSFLSQKDAGVSPREVYLTAMLNMFTLFLRALYAHIMGNTFAVWSPFYIPHHFVGKSLSDGVVDEAAGDIDASAVFVKPSPEGYSDNSPTVLAVELGFECEQICSLASSDVEQPNASGHCNLRKLSL